MPALSKKTWYPLFFILPVILLFFSCQKDASSKSDDQPATPSDLETKIAGTVSGFVIDENNAPVQGATVQFGSFTTATDKHGYFEAANIQVVKNAAFVSIAKTGYFKGIKTFIAATGKKAFFRIKLIPKTIAGSFSAASGGNVTLANGLRIALPANAIVNAGTNAAYAGTVNIAARLIEPSDADLNLMMPGNLRGLNTKNEIKLLKNFGVAAVELTGAAGELLQIAPGKNATLTMPIPSNMTADAPASLPLWYFDETRGLWKEEGSALRTVNSYTGDVAHFSYWYYFYPFPDAVDFSCTVVDAAGTPMKGLEVYINYNTLIYPVCYGITDSLGVAEGQVPANSQLVCKIYNSNCLSSTLYSQNFASTNTSISLGTITIPPALSGTITGRLIDCNNQPINNGYLLIQRGEFYTRYFLNAPNFSIPVTLCGTNNIIVIGGDPQSGQEAVPQNITLSPGNNALGDILACGSSAIEFFNYTIDGNSYSINRSVPFNYMSQTPDSLNSNATRILGYIAYPTSSAITLGLSTVGIAPGNAQTATYFSSDITQLTTIPTPFNVNITEYGAVGQFIAGNFTGAVTSVAPPAATHTVSGSFRIRRNY